MNYKLASLIINSSQKSGSTGDVFISQQDKNQEDLTGKLFILFDIDARQSRAKDLIDFFVAEISENYFKSERFLYKENLESDKLEHIFEHALAKTNKNFIEFIKNEEMEIDPAALNITVGLIQGNDIHLANFGKNRCYLICPDKKSLSYKMINIAKEKPRTDDQPLPAANLAKLFSSLISGHLPAEAYFFITNEALPEYFSDKQLISTITALPPSGAVEQIKNNLGLINSYISFFGLIIKSPFGENAEPEPVKITTSQESIRNLNATENNTEKYLAPSGIINIKDKLDFAWDRIKSLLPGTMAKTQLPAKTLIIKDKIFFARRSGWQRTKKTFSIIRETAANFIFKSGEILKKISFRKIGLFLTALGAGIYHSAIALKSFFWKLKKIHKISLLVILLCILAFSGNLILAKKKKAAEEQASRFAALLQEIEQKQTQIDASLLYDNNTKAQELFTETDNLIKQAETPGSAPDTASQDKINEFKNKYREQLSKLSKQTIIASPEKLTAANAAAEGADFNELTLVNNEKLYLADNQTKTIYSFILSSGEHTDIPVKDETVDKLSWLTENGGGILYSLYTSGILRLDSSNNSLLALKFTPPATSIAALTVFNNRFYVLNSATGQIERYDKRGNDITGKVDWLSSPADFSQAADLSIDGKIYVLWPDKVGIFADGKAEDFTLAEVLPALTAAKRLVASPEKDYLYIMEPANKRIVIFNKKGELVVQYYSEAFSDLRDFAVDEKAKAIYVLSGDSVYKIPADFL